MSFTRKPSRPDGQPKGGGQSKKIRDAGRMLSLLESKTTSWADQADLQDRHDEEVARITSGAASSGEKKPYWRKARNETPPTEPQTSTTADLVMRLTKGRGAAEFSATSESAPSNAPMWDVDGMLGTKPVAPIYSENPDFSTFPTLLQTVYGELKSQEVRLDRRMPFCVFQHAMTEYLTAYNLDYQKSVNKDNRFTGLVNPRAVVGAEMAIIPEPIAEYFEQIGNSVSPQGDQVRLNLPNAAVPHGSLPAVVQAVEQPVPVDPDDPDGPQQLVVAEVVQAGYLPSGSFGSVDEESFPAYASNVSPYVTRRLIEHTRDVAPANIGNDWNVFPVGRSPAGATANVNLLGYRKPEMLDIPGKQLLREVVFADGMGTAGRLSHSSEVIAITNRTLRELRTTMKMRHGLPSPRKGHPYGGFVRTVIVSEPGGNIQDLPTQVRSCVALGPSSSARSYLTGLRRERTEGAPGLCYTVNGEALDGWVDHINDNFNMVGDFAPVIGVDRASLRDNNFYETPVGVMRTTVLRDWIVRKHLGNP